MKIMIVMEQPMKAVLLPNVKMDLQPHVLFQEYMVPVHNDQKYVVVNECERYVSRIYSRRLRFVVIR